MLDFSPPPETVAKAAQVRRFMADVVISREAEVAADADRLTVIRAELQQAAREAGVFAPRVPTAYGGLGLDWRDSAPVFEAAGRSLLGPQARTGAMQPMGAA